MPDLPGHASGSEDVDFNEIWFANQLIHNACATQAILNVIFNSPQLDIGDKLRNFKDFTRNMGPKVGESLLLIYEEQCITESGPHR